MVDTLAGLLAAPLRHLYVMLWRAGLLEIE